MPLRYPTGLRTNDCQEEVDDYGNPCSWRNAMTTTVMLLVVGLSLPLEGPKDDPVKKELKQLEGAWQATSLEQDGEKATEAVVKQMKLVVEGQKATFFAGDTVLLQGTIKLDPATKPKALDVASRAGRLKDQTVEGIYEFDGDAVKICLGSPGGVRPTEFKSGKDQPLVTYQRVKR
jgi:uncharacterized protein (TIGR03067 family)